MKGRRLRAPSGLTTRPTSDKVKVALFNILGPPPQGAVALDLFAGTGALGLEALSRGCERGVFVERDRAALACIEENIAHLGMDKRAEVLACDVERGLVRLTKAAVPPFSWIFIDPPYGADLGPVLGRLQELCSEQGCVIVEHSSRDEAPLSSGFAIADTRKYGDTALTFLRPAQTAGDSAEKGAPLS